MYYNYKNNLREKMLLELNDKNIKDLIEIEEKCFKDSLFKLKKNGFKYHLKKRKVLGIIENNKVVAYLVFAKYHENKYNLFYLASSIEKKGYATQLLKEFKDIVKNDIVSLDCLEDKINFYKMFIDVEKIKIVKNYFGNGINGYILKGKFK